MVTRDSLYDWRNAYALTDEYLSSLSEKSKFFSSEVSYRETLCRISTKLPAHNLARVGQVVSDTGLCIFKPDAIFHGKVDATLKFLADRGIYPYRFAVINIDRERVQEIWRYVLNIASRARVELLNLLFHSGPSIVAFFWPRVRFVDVPCSVVLTDLKGRSETREGWELRSVLESPHPMEQYVHTSDEPADVIREAALLLGCEQAASVLAETDKDHKEDCTARLLTEAARLRSLAQNGVFTAPVLHPALERLAHSTAEKFDTTDPDSPEAFWALFRKICGICPLYSAPAPCLIDSSGTAAWWDEIGLLGERSKILRHGLQRTSRAQENVT